MTIKKQCRHAKPAGFETRWHLICHEPYRILFPLGILAGFSGVAHWLLYGFGWSEGYSGYFHALVQSQVYLNAFVFGFLLTAIPRLASAPRTKPSELSTVLIVLVATNAFLLAHRWVLAETCFILLLLFLARFILVRFLQKDDSPTPPPAEFLWIPIGILHGILGGLMTIGVFLINRPPHWVKVGPALAQQGFLIAIVAGIAGFLAPRLMGRTEVLDPKRRSPLALHVIAGALLLGSFFLEAGGSIRLAYGLRASLLAWLFWRNHAWPHWPRNKADYVRLLWLSIGMLVVGYGCIAIAPAYRKEFLHVAFIGGYSLMTFAVGSMVILSHSGDADRLKIGWWPLRLAAVGLAFALGLRIYAAFVPSHYFLLLGLGSIFWLLSATLWLVCTLPYLFKTPSQETFEETHERMKQEAHSSSPSPECCEE